jgi:hypothetical protein
MKLVSLIKMCLNETCSKVNLGKHLSDTFPIQNGLKQGDALLPLIFYVQHNATILRFVSHPPLPSPPPPHFMI